MATSNQPKVPPASGTQPARAVVFVSYAREDKEFAVHLADGLRLKGVEVRGDWQLLRGEDYERQLKDLQLGADVLVFILSPDSVRSAPCRAELELAGEQRQRILPVVFRDVSEQKNELPQELSSPQWTFLRPADDFVAGVQGLVEAINTDVDLMPEHRRLLQAAEIWQRNGRSPSYLLRKEGLKTSETWLAKTGADSNQLPKPTVLQLEYLRASRSAQARGSRIALIVASLIAVAVVLAIVAFFQRQHAKSEQTIAEEQRREAQRQKTAAESSAKDATRQRDEATRQLADAFALPAASARRDHNYLAARVYLAASREQALTPRGLLEGLALSANPAVFIRDLNAPGDRETAPVFSPTDDLLAIGSPDGFVRILDARNWKQRTRLGPHRSAGVVARV